RWYRVTEAVTLKHESAGANDGLKSLNESAGNCCRSAQPRCRRDAPASAGAPAAPRELSCPSAEMRCIPLDMTDER
ncbi:hypothetical protein DV515_00009528, partial [Chloebia gouldiae]